MKLSFFFLLLAYLFPLLAGLELTPIGEAKTKEKHLAISDQKKNLYLFEDETIVIITFPAKPNESWLDGFYTYSCLPQFDFDQERWGESVSFQLYAYEQLPSPTADSSLYLSLHPPVSDDLQLEYPCLIENRETGQMAFCKILTTRELCDFTIKYGQERFEAGLRRGRNWALLYLMAP